MEYSVIASIDDDFIKPSPRLIDVSLRSITLASKISLETVSQRMKAPPFYPNLYPGEHYRLLAALVKILEPRNVVEIGTGTGLSSLSMLTTLRRDGRITTFDILPWQEDTGSFLTEKDFEDRRLEQIIADLSEPPQFERHFARIHTADLIFMDGPKNITFEKTFLQHIQDTLVDSSPLLVLDDIRIWNMLKIWRDISRPKLDLTSFGHWTGTGIVDWSEGESAT